jgi:hypothetical protein
MPDQEDNKFRLLAGPVAALLPDGVIERTLYVGREHREIMKILPGREMTRRDIRDDEPFLGDPFLGWPPETSSGYDMIVLYGVLDHPRLLHAFSHVQRIVDPALKSGGWLMSCHGAETRRRFAYTLADMATVSCGGRDWRIEVFRK